MNINGNGSDEDDIFDELHPEIEALKPKFAQLLQKRMEVEESTSFDDANKRAEIEDIYKEQMRGAFLTHSIATEEDFERLWPRLKDDTLCEHATNVYFQVIDALVEDMEDDDI